ncbi:hypothetical protein BGZ60DRAFT_262636 [Tricladium varicosporioides]|nr:hypothetical protein BGZ60DRAFT_262636 [Hymenoscyphus varicosporioides]
MSKFRSPGKWRSDAPSRSNTGSSIRGRIGPPIPIPDDDEFPIRAPGTGIATPLGSEGMEQQMRQRLSTATDLQNVSPKTGHATADFTEPRKVTPPPVQPMTESPPRRTNIPSAMRHSTASIPSKSSVGKPQRKKSSLKSVLGRLFGKKRKNGSLSSLEKTHSPGDVRAGQHRSDPTALSRSPKEGAQKRSASLPINEYNRALRSHSVITTEDFPLDSATNPNRDSVQTNPQTRPRRATTPSRLWTPTKLPGYADWTGLSPRPASSHARGSKYISEAEAEAVIGMAVTSGSHPNRRSRSLGELRGAMMAPSIARRRSDEIRYWRESYDPGILSPMSSNRAEAEDPILPDELDDPPVEPEDTPQPFNFGPMGEMAGMKITQAASLETRVQRLESRMQKMEKTILRLHRNQSMDALHLQDPPKRNPNRTLIPRPSTTTSDNSLPRHDIYQDLRHRAQEDGHGSQIRSSSHGSSRPATTETNPPYLPDPGTFPLPTSDATVISSHSARPLSTSTTIRGIPSSSPTIPKDGSFTNEHYTYLTNMILAEQSSRQRLEDIVQNLQQQLQAVISAQAAAYPTPNSATDRLTEATIGRDEFSNFEQDDDSDDEGGYGSGEVFQTPNEERGGFGDDTFGAVMSSDDTKVPSRTMSLSQMTLGRGVQLV